MRRDKGRRFVEQALLLCACLNLPSRGTFSRQIQKGKRFLILIFGIEQHLGQHTARCVDARLFATTVTSRKYMTQKILIDQSFSFLPILVDTSFFAVNNNIKSIFNSIMIIGNNLCGLRPHTQCWCL